MCEGCAALGYCAAMSMSGPAIFLQVASLKPTSFGYFSCSSGLSQKATDDIVLINPFETEEAL